jgi:outer membrane lipopolysaccharide assembly protein LptE/RlpB
LWIGPVDDEGDEPLFGARLSQALARNALNRADAPLVRREQAQALLSVRVDSVNESAAAYSAVDVIREYILKAEVTATLTRPGGPVLWRGRNIRAQREFPAGSDVNETEDNKDRASERLARDLAREVLRRVSLALQEADS